MIETLFGTPGNVSSTTLDSTKPLKIISINTEMIDIPIIVSLNNPLNLVHFALSSSSTLTNP